MPITEKQIEDFVDSDYTLEELKRWRERIDLRIAVEKTITMAKEGKYISMNRRIQVKEWLEDWNKSNEYVV